MDDDAQMQRAIAGDTKAFGRLVQVYQPLVLRVAERMLGDREAAKDVTQETFLRLWRGRARYVCQGQFRAFLMRITRNACLDYARSAPPRPLGLDDLLREDLLSDESKEAGCSIGQTVETQVLGEIVRHAIEALPEAQRAVFVLSHYEGLTYREIADALGCPVGTVASRKLAAVTALRQRLHTWNEERAL